MSERDRQTDRVRERQREITNKSQKKVEGFVLTSSRRK